jgi:phenylalanyl-tRNA synthetase alpha chain
MPVFLDKLNEIKNDFFVKIDKADDEIKIENIRNIFFGKDGKLQKITEDFKLLPLEEKKKIGGILQEIKKELSDLFFKKKEEIFLKNIGYCCDVDFDPSLNFGFDESSNEHPYTNFFKIVNDFFKSLGFEYSEGPVVDTKEFNFTALNIPDDHPACDEMDTFWLQKKDYLLRTHTSTVQIHESRKRKPPFGIFSFGQVYRNESTDASHDIMFYQLEGMYISNDASLSNLIFTLKSFFRNLFKKDNLEIRVRPGIFPFVEPGIEIDFECPFCENGCSTCKKTKWIEIGGAGMIHKNVLKAMNIDDENMQGWAFGMGATRLAMLIFNVNDVRELHNKIF